MIRVNKVISALPMFMALLAACSPQGGKSENTEAKANESNKVKPLYITDSVEYDTDDPAVWINHENPAQSLILGTDKDMAGALYVFNLQGKEIKGKTVKGLQRPNNVDVEYGLQLGGKPVDIAVVAERLTASLRVFSLPGMQPLDNGGLPVYEGETQTGYRDPMGISLYKRPTDGAIFAIVSRKNGPTDGTYLWQYLLEDNGNGQVKATVVRKFGAFSGTKEIESIAVDDDLGYVYYSDEQVGVRKYHADPGAGNDQLALFATEGFAKDHEGISIYAMSEGKGYLLVSDQGADKFRIFTREGTEGNSHLHRLVKVIDTSTHLSDGSETVNYPLGPDFPHGLFVAMSEGRTFQIYRWEDLAGSDLRF